MQRNHRLLNTAFTSLGIASSLLVAMLCIEFMVVGNFENVLAYTCISAFVASIYLISMTINQKRQKNK
ncbi:hypothetical protein [Alkalimarinus coralli]|uniref:hypothetical protein n=1 Tax=Alkalimarinus coralli TaxID=2935863 RepID=UPI00202AFEE5|nr:hypothetical protein [Alkalimarinus coralli]